MAGRRVALAALSALASSALVAGAAFKKAARVDSSALQRTWDQALDGAGGKDTPVKRVVGLLQTMQSQLEKDMDQDEALFKELACWCNTNTYEKEEAVKASTAKIAELESTIESLTAKSAELANTIKEVEEQYASDKKALAEASALREAQLAEFHGGEKDSIQALENLKAAITVLSKHQGPENAPGSTVAGGAVFKTEKQAWSLLATGSRSFPWASSHEDADARQLDDFLGTSRLGEQAPLLTAQPAEQRTFLQRPAAARADSAASHAGGVAALSEEELAFVKRAMASATAFVQAHHNAGYTPAYQSQSGEIFGILQQLREEMEGGLAESQRIETERAAAFKELRDAKELQLADGYKMSEQKEDEKAQTDNNLAEAKEDLGEQQRILAEASEFLKNLETMCAQGQKNFDERKSARLSEMQAVGETINILQADEARDAMSGTYSAAFVQVASARHSAVRRRAASALRAQARRSKDPQLAMLATSVELDSFTKVKAAIDEMVSMLKQQQEDEVKKNDFCKAELHQNEMSTAKKTDEKDGLEAKIGELEVALRAHTEAIAAAKAQVAQLELDLQRFSEDRLKANLEFQTTVADQTTTVAVLKKALDRLATYYDLLQRGQAGRRGRQTPPVPQMEYAPNKGSAGVMEMIEKLIHEAEGLRADAKKSEGEAEAAYEQTIADTNGSVEALQKEIVSREKAMADATKDKLQAESDHKDAIQDLFELSEYNGDLHDECDYVLRNFDVRQSGRQTEIEALQQAKQILSGAALS